MVSKLSDSSGEVGKVFAKGVHLKVSSGEMVGLLDDVSMELSLKASFLSL